MDNEMIERCAEALENRFKTIIAETAGMLFEETKVNLPNRKLWADYTVTIIKAMREPTEKMLKANINPELTYSNDMVWEAYIDCILNN